MDAAKARFSDYLIRAGCPCCGAAGRRWRIWHDDHGRLTMACRDCQAMVILDLGQFHIYRAVGGQAFDTDEDSEEAMREF